MRTKFPYPTEAEFEAARSIFAERYLSASRDPEIDREERLQHVACLAIAQEGMSSSAVNLDRALGVTDYLEAQGASGEEAHFVRRALLGHFYPSTVLSEGPLLLPGVLADDRGDDLDVAELIGVTLQELEA